MVEFEDEWIQEVKSRTLKYNCDDAETAGTLFVGETVDPASSRLERQVTLPVGGCPGFGIWRQAPMSWIWAGSWADPRFASGRGLSHTGFEQSSDRSRIVGCGTVAAESVYDRDCQGRDKPAFGCGGETNGVSESENGSVAA
ncbi:hypothetical protein SCAR479_04223 [Seiridium cardinale]|uniref:Uncharacterized protein n=1 Tax=Seiridium cardinale TaxID=138064 RepID=A0ABR2XZ12_9PEZI